MADRVFQPAVMEMKEATDRMLGVIDSAGAVVACSDPTLIGNCWEDAAAGLDLAEGFVNWGGYTFKALRRASARFDFAAFAQGEDGTAKSLCGLAAAGLGCAKDFYEEKHGRETFIKNIILDNLLPGDIHVKSREMGLDGGRRRAVLLIRQNGEPDSAVPDVLKNLFPERRRDFVISVSESESVLVKDIGDEQSDLRELAVAIDSTLRGELMVNPVIGIGSACKQIKDLAASYKEARIAIEVGKVFDTAKSIVSYESLGLGRLIYQLPTTMCEMFLSEVFKHNDISSLDRETLETIRCFFENNLNISETSRKLFVHRNTLVYRLDKIRKMTGIDLREFDDAVVFKVAMMVTRYLAAQGAEQQG